MGKAEGNRTPKQRAADDAKKADAKKTVASPDPSSPQWQAEAENIRKLRASPLLQAEAERMRLLRESPHWQAEAENIRKLRASPLLQAEAERMRLLRESPHWQAEQKCMRQLREKLRKAEMARASPQEPTSQRRKPRKRGGGRKPSLTQEKIEKGILILRSQSRMTVEAARQTLRDAGIDTTDTPLYELVIRPAYGSR
jgi:hypothetical protein